MPLSPYLLSLCLHAAVIILILLWPASKPPINLEKPVLISLVEGAPGGNQAPSPIMGHAGPKAEGEPAPTPPAPQAQVAAHEREEAKQAPVIAPKDVRPMKKEEPKKPELRPEPKKEPVPKEKAVSVKKQPEKEKPKEKKPEKEKPAEKKQPPQEPKQPQKQKDTGKDKKDAEQKAAKSSKDAISAALNQAKRSATSRASSGDKGSAVEQALAQARKKAGGNGGGGGGSGSGPGGGGLHSVYLGQVMLAVRPNWGYPTAGKKNLQCTVKISVEKDGTVKAAKVTSSSGNPQYDSSCISAIKRTSSAGDFPPPPSPEYQELDIVFTLNELRGR